MWIKLKRHYHKIGVYSKIELEVETQLHLFDALIKPILLYSCEVWDTKMSNKLKFSTEIVEKDIKN